MSAGHPPRPFPPRGVILDCDGVVVDSRKLCRFVYNHLLGELGLGRLTPEQERFVFVNTAESSLKELIPAEHIAWARKAKGEIPPSEYLPLIEPNPGVRDFLATLQDMGIPAALNTNGGKRAHTMLKAFGLEQYFSLVVTARDVIQPKPHPEGIFKIMAEWRLGPDHVVFVGDSDLDRQAALAAGIRFWSYGPEAPEAGWHLKSFGLAAELLASTKRSA